MYFRYFPGTYVIHPLVITRLAAAFWKPVGRPHIAALAPWQPFFNLALNGWMAAIHLYERKLRNGAQTVLEWILSQCLRWGKCFHSTLSQVAEHLQYKPSQPHSWDNNNHSVCLQAATMSPGGGGVKVSGPSEPDDLWDITVMGSGCPVHQAPTPPQEKWGRWAQLPALGTLSPAAAWQPAKAATSRTAAGTWTVELQSLIPSQQHPLPAITRLPLWPQPYLAPQRPRPAAISSEGLNPTPTATRAQLWPGKSSGRVRTGQGLITLTQMPLAITDRALEPVPQ